MTNDLPNETALVVVTGGTLPQKEINKYLEYCRQKYKAQRIERLEIKVDGEYVDLKIHFKSVPFERIRRITGYLVGTLDRFNNAKRAEVGERVKHGTENFY